MLPQYEILGILGRGGMGAVYKGRQAKLDRIVAIKVLPETFTKGDDQLNFVKRFEQEAKAMAKLDHPAILSVYDFGETAEGELYFVMEFVDGMDIHQYLKLHGGKLPQEHALSICAHVLDALEYAHAHGIVHRDIKPANILLNREGRIKIADFGLAKKFGDHADAEAPALTMSNVAVGTPDFVAPEALDRDQVPDHRADLYAVGVMLYQMLTGKLPRGNYQMPSELNPEIDPRLDEIVSTAMAADPDYRYGSAGAVRADLDLVLSSPLARVAAGEPSGAVKAVVPVTTSLRGKKAPPKPASKTPLVVGLGAAALVIAGLVILLAGKRGEPETLPALLPEVIVEKTPALPLQAATPASGAPAEKTPEPIAKSDTVVPNAEEIVAPASPPVNSSEGMKAAAMAESPAEAAESERKVEPSGKTGETPVLPSTDPLANLPGLQTRLNGYLKARRTQLAELATKYGRTLDSRLNQAADAGDLKVTTAFDEEKLRVATLVASLAAPATDPRAAVSHSPALPELPEGSPETLVILRETWTNESRKLLAALDAALQQSLQALEVELTKARDLEKARAVLAYRESLASETSVVASVGQAAPLPSELKRTQPAAGAAALQSSPDLTRATKDAPFENSLGMKFVPVKDTDVLFCIHEVRYKDYAAYAAEAKGIDGSWRDQRGDGFAPTDRPEDHPVMKVNWDDAQAFCDWLSRKESKRYRLPTDREWSVAVGIGRAEKWKSDTTPATVFKEPTTLPWGNEWPPPKGAGNYSDESRRERASHPDAKYIDGYDDTFPTTAPVMSFEPNKIGLYDLGGNVWEWCEDWYDDSKETRVMRGSAWYLAVRSHLHSSNRVGLRPAARAEVYGFRIVADLAAPPPTITPVPPSPVQPPSVVSPELARTTKNAPFENSLAMKFVPVPDTEVLFCIHETRYKDYAAYAAETAGVDELWKDQSADGFTPADRNEDHPVTRVSWHDAKAFCAWLSKKEGRTYRLPTDQEWSIAVGIGKVEHWNPSMRPADIYKDPNAFPWGDEWPPPKGAGNYSDESRREKAPHPDAKYIDGYVDTFPTTSPVMSFAPNKIGLFDLGGNVWEWCEDWFSHEDKERVLRGGSWSHIERPFVLSSSRSHPLPDNRRSINGFRIILEVASAPAPVAAAPKVAPPNPPPVVAASTRAGQDAPSENSLGMKFVPVPDTEVLFCIHEVRWKDYAAYAKENPEIAPIWRNQTFFGIEIKENAEDHPVGLIQLEDAQAFCHWLSKKEGLTYRLPTDHEWSMAVGIGKMEDDKAAPQEKSGKIEGQYPWGNEWPPPQGAGNYSDESRKAKAPLNSGETIYLEGYDDGFPTTSPVMSFKPNSLGLYDLGGNVVEWVADWNSTGSRVLRGGGWGAGNSIVTESSFRFVFSPTARNHDFGFRLVLAK